MATPTTSIRLRPKLRAEIERIATRRKRPLSEVIQVLLEEAVSMERCPGIYFATDVTGREAKVQGTGLGVWEVIRDYRANEGDGDRLRQLLPHIGPAQLEAALRYSKLYPQEIDPKIDANQRAFDEGSRTGFVVQA
jgi:uncharacterized protein (DUF433 family)